MAQLPAFYLRDGVRGEVVQHDVHIQPGGTSASISSRKARNPFALCLAVRVQVQPDHIFDLLSKALIR